MKERIENLKRMSKYSKKSRRGKITVNLYFIYKIILSSELKKLRNENEYEEKLSKVNEQIFKKKEEFKKVQKELLENQKNTQKDHEYLVRLMEENAILRYNLFVK